MIKFLLKGILRDRSRSILPIIITALGVGLTVLLSGYLKGAFGDIIDQNARFETGHVKVMTQAYAENKDQVPNDLALLNVSEWMDTLRADYPQMQWIQRIKFGGLIDVPNAEGNTRAQGPATGMALDLFSGKSGENKRMNLEASLVTGTIPKDSGNAIIGHDFSEKLNLNLGDEITLFGSTMNGSMTFKTFIISGTIRFGTSAMDKGALIIDISDAQLMLDMDNATGEILGYLKSGVYEESETSSVAASFNDSYKQFTDEFSPEMLTLREQNNLASLLDYADVMSALFIFIFVLAMSIVLWNTGLLGGLRRYQEFGIRLALGESKANIYWSMVMEAVLIGVIGSILGTIIGLGITYYMQVVGIDISSYLDNSSMIMPSVLRAKITPSLFYIGFIPGVLAMVFGTMLAGIGIYKRETANLFSELEV
ncbi:ABC transporter permease [Winogradskyella bathintestinalis]|uniref:FtsX-like permease family protein n=1 Tax=Winogradskyella bathintestinalis TaxID=3035208 RepID=A0ABT7ZX77_9FLAO|nr:FtsX-like permease family protein [Winogradskyella bathintestinalis]MDN3493609.1 FtsX-like permease family protein [Winogradskyella bathintestinalis]